MSNKKYWKRREFLGLVGRAAIGGSAAAVLSSFAPGAFAGVRRLNFVFILIDDLGWADLPCYGNTFHETPNIDRLASEGMRFTDAYAAAPVCSPTRASILTGKYPARLNLTDFIPGHWRPWAKLRVPAFNQQLPLEEVTIAEALKPAGYVSACIGKWHLGGKGFQPGAQGFDYVMARGRNEKDKQVRALTDAALEFITINRDRPFFLYLSHYTVHIPLQAKQELVEKYQSQVKRMQAQNNPVYAAMIEVMDNSVGRLMKKLAELRIADRTVVVFTSDNGGLIQMYRGTGPIVTSNAPLRAEKGTLYEGGIRVPLIVRWPGVVQPGSTCNVPVSSVDFYPTLLEMADLQVNRLIDGESLVPLLKRTGDLQRSALYWHYPHYHHSTPAGAIRQGNFKLIEFYEDGRLELYNLKEDLGEKHDLANGMPQKAEELRRNLADWRQWVNARLPTANPNYEPQRAGEWGSRPKPRQQRPLPRRQR